MFLILCNQQLLIDSNYECKWKTRINCLRRWTECFWIKCCLGRSRAATLLTSFTFIQLVFQWRTYVHYLSTWLTKITKAQTLKWTLLFLTIEKKQSIFGGIVSSNNCFLFWKRVFKKSIKNFPFTQKTFFSHLVFEPWGHT